MRVHFCGLRHISTSGLGGSGYRRPFLAVFALLTPDRPLWTSLELSKRSVTLDISTSGLPETGSSFLASSEWPIDPHRVLGSTRRSYWTSPMPL